jgi:hypothetical protein
MINFRSIVLTTVIGTCLPALGGDQPIVHVEQPNLHSPRQLQEQTAKAAVQDYIDAWQRMSSALDQNRPDLLDRDFIGDAKDKLADTIKQQTSAGLHTRYRDQSHEVKILFYSPEGLSIELSDTVKYDMQVLDHDKTLGYQQFRARYIVVLTPTEVRWRVRIFQAQAES